MCLMFVIPSTLMADNVALLTLGATATDNGHYGTRVASAAIDGDRIGSYWGGLEGSYPQVLTITFDQVYNWWINRYE